VDVRVQQLDVVSASRQIAILIEASVGWRVANFNVVEGDVMGVVGFQDTFMTTHAAVGPTVED
jgi:hypothetical protein